MEYVSESSSQRTGQLGLSNFVQGCSDCLTLCSLSPLPTSFRVMPACLSKLLYVVLEKTLGREDTQASREKVHLWPEFPSPVRTVPSRKPCLKASAASELHPLLLPSASGQELVMVFNTFRYLNFLKSFACQFNSSSLFNQSLNKILSDFYLNHMRQTLFLV